MVFEVFVSAKCVYRIIYHISYLNRVVKEFCHFLFLFFFFKLFYKYPWVLVYEVFISTKCIYRMYLSYFLFNFRNKIILSFFIFCAIFRILLIFLRLKYIGILGFLWYSQKIPKNKKWQNYFITQIIQEIC